MQCLKSDDIANDQFWSTKSQKPLLNFAQVLKTLFAEREIFKLLRHAKSSSQLFHTIFILTNPIVTFHSLFLQVLPILNFLHALSLMA